LQATNEYAMQHKHKYGKYKIIISNICHNNF